MEQLICHLIGDYWLQNDWMALNKKDKWWIALLHSAIYTIPFLFLTLSPLALIIICVTHALIDGSNIVAYLTKVRNGFGFTFKMPICDNKGAMEINENGCNPFGYNQSRPIWLCVMLSIVQDNTLHLLCNCVALSHF